MGVYSWKIKDMVKSYAQDPWLPLNQQVDKSLPHFFNFYYPIWSEEYRRVLERKIIMRYMSKEICSEDVGEWKIFLEQKLNEIMPYYNNLYLTTSKEFDWLEDINNVETFEGNKDSTGRVKGKVENDNTQNDKSVSNENTNGDIVTSDNNNSSSDSKTTGKSKTLKSDLPQVNYAGVDYGTILDENSSEDVNISTSEELKNGTVKSLDERNVTSSLDSKINGVVDSSTDTNSKENDVYTRVRKGLSGSKSLTQLNMEYRESLINIDKMIVDELKALFMILWR